MGLSPFGVGQIEFAVGPFLWRMFVLLYMEVVQNIHLGWAGTVSVGALPPGSVVQWFHHSCPWAPLVQRAHDLPRHGGPSWPVLPNR